MKILLITDYLPYPPISGDSIRVYNLIKHIAVEHQVTLVSLFGSPETQTSAFPLDEYCDQIISVDHQWPDPIKIFPDLIKFFVKGIPIELRLLFSQKLFDAISEITRTEDFDIVQIEHSRMALYLDALQPSGQFKTTLTFHNVGFDQYKNISRIATTNLGKLRSWLHSKMMRLWEPKYAERFDRSIVVSESDRSILLDANPQLTIDNVPNGVDTQAYQPLTYEGTKPSLLFVGSMSYAPNVDGAVWFCSRVLPWIRREIENVQVWIVGNSPLEEVVQLSGNGVHVTGRVDDIVAYYKQSTVSIVPLRAGGGTRLKILESMALGRPVVSTTLGCEGLNADDNRHLLVADDPKAFAKKTIRLLTDKNLCQNLTTNAREFVEANYDWALISRRMLDIYSDLHGSR
ncbi:MAG: glycosyltransferase [Anaerolineae bacterium]|nr:glycosyltransferase [Anaerolineae bacterium]MBT4310638.1 glycosyltransferase [Anaerolineae bacterium]MBT4456933.1 glycosyltransferase [Anaerolineae bacterium]MBT4843679.1 glycosyltransferase [Anaerolineae bacterium]MBT6060329.1 glycosyltransferase [Anaerolineae bacterium]